MFPRYNALLLVIHISAALFVLAGCNPQLTKPINSCSGKDLQFDPLYQLQTIANNAVPIKANGQCRLEFYDEEGKLKKESFPVKLWVNPANEMYMQGDVAFDPKGVVLGSNSEQFWVAIRLKEINSYWWGNWSEQELADILIVDPGILLEVMGFWNPADFKQGSVFEENGFRMLTAGTYTGAQRRLYFSTADCLVKKIEYVDGDGDVIIQAELDKYNKIGEGFFAPGFVKITTYSDDGQAPAVVTIKFSSIKETAFSQKQKDIMFNRPRPDGFENIHRMINGRIIEQ